MLDFARKAESRWIWSEGTSTTKDTWVEMCGDGEGAAIKDDAALV